MRRMIALLICVMLLATLCVPAWADVSEVMKVVKCSEWVSLRETPDTTSKRLAKVKLGEMVRECKDLGNGWIQCEYQSKKGYIQAQYLATTYYDEYTELMVNQLVVNCQEWVSMREMPNSNAKVMRKVPLGAVVTSCIYIGAGYVECTYKGDRGYISKDYLTAAPDNDVTKQDADVVKKYTGKYPAITGDMTIVNCKEWVSLRVKASDSSARITKVALGATVTDCLQVSDQFIYCRYNGLWGYIQAQYLQEIQAEPEGVHLADLPALPAAEQLLSAGTTILRQYLENGYTVIAQREQYENTETLLAVCYDAHMKPLWAVGDSVKEISELTQLDAFLGGTWDEPILVTYTADCTFRAYKVGPWTDVYWECADEAAQNVGGGLLHALDVDGTAYVIGYYAGRMACLDTLTGQIRWCVQLADADTYWPFEIEVGETSLKVLFDCIPEDDTMCREMTLSKDDGTPLSLGLRTKP